MLTLKEARKIAVNLTNDKFDIPQANSLRQWTNKDIISGVEKFDQKGRGGGRIGLYDDSLPIQISIISELKEIFGFKITFKAVKGIPKLINKNDLSIEEITSQLAEEKNLERGVMSKKYKFIKAEEYGDYLKGKKIKDYSIKKRQTIIDNIENWMFANMLKASNYAEVQKAKEEILEYIDNIEKMVILERYKGLWYKYKDRLKEYENNN
ncbi:MAG: hypothetical protein ACOCRX_05985 [Candidatus Woesearchaeota archaeon]